MYDTSEHREGSANILTDAQRRVFKRARLDFQIIQKQSDEQAKFDLFQRLNSGTRLSEQEARHCLAVMLDPPFARWLQELANDEHFANTLDISDRLADEAYDVESVLRFLAITKTADENLVGMGDVGEFLTTRMRDFIDDEHFDVQAENEKFRGVFRLLDTALGADAFKRPGADGQRFSGRFSVSAFEAVSSGLARNWDRWRNYEAVDRDSEVISRVVQVWGDPEYQSRAGGGRAAERRIPYMVRVGARTFA